MLRLLVRIVTPLAAAGTLLLGLAAPASAGVSPDATFYDSVDHYGNSSLGYVFVEGGANQLYSNTSYYTTGINGFGTIEKGYKARSVQVDFVRLGNATRGGIIAQTNVPRNSGLSGTSASAETRRWTPMREASDPACTGASFKVWTRVGYSVRWTDGTLSRWTVLGPQSSTEYCRA